VRAEIKAWKRKERKEKEMERQRRRENKHDINIQKDDQPKKKAYTDLTAYP